MFYRTAFALLISFLPHLVFTSADLVWHEYEGRCYIIPSASLPFNDAKQTCTNIGAELVEIDTEEELRFIQSSIVLDTSYQYWVGLEHNGTGYQWMQSKKSPPPYMWLEDEPNASGTCVRLLTGATLHPTSTASNMDEFLLGDHDCNNSYKTVCEKDSGPHDEQAYTLSMPSKYQCAMKSFTARSRVQCGRACAVHSICLGFQYDNLTRDCILTEFASVCSTSLPSNLSMYIMNVPRC